MRRTTWARLLYSPSSVTADCLHARTGGGEQERIAEKLPASQVERLRCDLRGGRGFAKRVHVVGFDATRAPDVSTACAPSPMVCVGSLSQCDRNSRTTRHTEELSRLIDTVSSVKEGDCWSPLRFFRCKALTTHQLFMHCRVMVVVVLPQ